jgi:predicted XRE-type DNA-binding protein
VWPHALNKCTKMKKEFANHAIMLVTIVLDLLKQNAISAKKIMTKLGIVHVKINAVIWNRSIKTRTLFVAIVVQSVKIVMEVVIVSASYA